MMFSKEFDDIYFSTEDGLAESRHTYLVGNDLPAAWLKEDGFKDFTIFELGFGSGLNFLATLELWQRTMPLLEHNGKEASPYYRQPRKHLHYIAVEKYPLPWCKISEGLSAWQSELAPQLQQLAEAYPDPIKSGIYSIAPGVKLELRIGDIADAIKLPRTATYNAIYLDGFSPAKNPEMWTQETMDYLMRCSSYQEGRKTTFATFTVAKSVQSALRQAGFTAKKVPGYGRKKEMLIGQVGSGYNSQD